MVNTSATGGYLVPDPTVGSEDDAFENMLGDAVAGITALPRGLVRPRWQAKPPAWPTPETDWCAIGVTESVSDSSAMTEHRAAGDGYDVVTRHETVTIVASFYGPRGFSLATMMRDGLMVSQNRDQMRAAGVAVQECSDIQSAPALMNEQWVRRWDLTLLARRAIVRTYPVLNLLSAHGSLQVEKGEYVQNFEVTEN